MEEGYSNCSKCKGTGHTSKTTICPKCLGVGILDWVEQVVGKKDSIVQLFTPQNMGSWKIDNTQDYIEVSTFGNIQSKHIPGNTTTTIEFNTNFSTLNCKVGDLGKVHANV